MTDRHPIEAGVDPGEGGDPDASEREGVEGDRFRVALARWASTVTLVSVRDGATVHGMTVTSFMPVSADPPEVVVAVGPNARVLPFLVEGVRFVVNLLASGQAGLASRYADAYPVGPSPFPSTGDPIADGAVTSLACRVRQVHPTDGDARLVVARVEDVVEGSGDSPLLWHERGPGRVAGS